MFHERTTNLLFLRDTPLSGETGTLVYINCGFFPSFYGDAHPLVEKRKEIKRDKKSLTLLWKEEEDAPDDCSRRKIKVQFFLFWKKMGNERPQTDSVGVGIAIASCSPISITSASNVGRKRRRERCICVFPLFFFVHKRIDRPVLECQHAVYVRLDAE